MNQTGVLLPGAMKSLSKHVCTCINVIQAQTSTKVRPVSGVVGKFKYPLKKRNNSAHAVGI
jgi:hypothetical protein